MSTTCLARNVSYATWRLQVLRRLYCLTHTDTSRLSISNSNANSSKKKHRKPYRPIVHLVRRVRAESNDLVISPEDVAREEPLANNKTSNIIQKHVVGKPGEDPFLPARRDETRSSTQKNVKEEAENGLSPPFTENDLLPLSTQDAKKTDILQSFHEFSDNQDTKSSSRGVVVEPDRALSLPLPQIWSPTTVAGRRALQGMMADLEALTKQDVKRSEREEQKPNERGEKKKKTEKSYTTIRYNRRSYDPVSPIERSTLYPSKIGPQKGKLDHTLLKNPWACILASPLRYCHATKARLPRDLMNNWGVVRNPKDQQDYLMPVELSDLKSFAESMEPDEEEELFMNSQDNSKKRRKKGGKKKLPAGERVQIQSSKLLIRAITKELIKVKSNGESHTSCHALVNALIPFRWRQNLEMAAAFRSTQKTIDSDTGRVRAADDDWRKDVPDLMSLQWQPDIHDRIQTIMRDRLMTALEGVSTNNASSKGIRSRRVIAIKIPESGRLKVDVGKVVPWDEDVTNSGKQSVASPKDVVDEGITTTQDPTLKQDLDTNRSEEVTALRRPWHHNSIFIHIGTPSQYMDRIKSWQNLKSSQPINTSTPAAKALLPPTILVNETLHLPIFNLQTLLGPSYIPHLQESILDHGVLDYRFWDTFDAEKQKYFDKKFADDRAADESTDPSIETSPSDSQSPSPDDTEFYLSLQSRIVKSNPEPEDVNREYMILVKSHAMNVADIATEMWQLWRYIGGWKGLWLGDGNVSDSDNGAVGQVEIKGEGRAKVQENNTKGSVEVETDTNPEPETGLFVEGGRMERASIERLTITASSS